TEFTFSGLRLWPVRSRYVRTCHSRWSPTVDELPGSPSMSTQTLASRSVRSSGYALVQRATIARVRRINARAAVRPPGRADPAGPAPYECPPTAAGGSAAPRGNPGPAPVHDG